MNNDYLSLHIGETKTLIHNLYIANVIYMVHIVIVNNGQEWYLQAFLQQDEQREQNTGPFCFLPSNHWMQ